MKAYGVDALCESIRGGRALQICFLLSSSAKFLLSFLIDLRASRFTSSKLNEVIVAGAQ